MDRQTRAASVDSSAWDGPAAMSGCAKMDDPAAYYNAICAGKKAGDPKTQAAHALPHHKKPGDPPNKSGVGAALSMLPQTDGLTNAAAAKAHLQAHQKAINPDYDSSKGMTPGEMRQARSASGTPGGSPRTRSFASRDMRANLVNRGGKSFYEFHGYATTFGQQYEMWDAFGPYLEGVRGSALNRSLSASPDVAFLVNHKGVTMARTTNDTLTMQKDLHGLAIDAWLNADRQDVRDFASAVNDGLITEMSFAFQLLDGEWEWADDTGAERDQFWITEADINRGDVSGVNYGANPGTEIAARAADWLADANLMPDPVIREVIKVISRRDDVMDFRSAARDLAKRATVLYATAAADLSARGVTTRAAGDTDSDDSLNGLVAALDATLDQASALVSGLDLTSVSPDVGQALGLLVAAESVADELMELLGIFDPDDAGEGAEKSAAPSDSRTSERAQELRDLDKPKPETGVTILSVANKLHALEEDL
jgi:HK97 family phage prohead protease